MRSVTPGLRGLADGGKRCQDGLGLSATASTLPVRNATFQQSQKALTVEYPRF